MMRMSNSALRIYPKLTRLFATQTSIPKSDYDITIVGTGPVGLALAAGLQTNPYTRSLKVAILDNKNTLMIQDWNPTSYSNRCVSVMARSRSFFERIGAWEHMRQERLQPFQHIYAYDGITNSTVHFDQPKNTDPMAFMAENVNLQYGLLRSILKRKDIRQDNFDFLVPCNIEKITRDENTNAPSIHTSTHGVLRTRLLVGADGRNSIVRQFAKIAMPGWAYPAHGVVGTLRVAQNNLPSVAFQRFLPTGPLAYLPLPGNNATFVWSIYPELAKKLLALPDPTFVKFLNAAFLLDQVDLDYLFKMDIVEPNNLDKQLDWRIETKRRSLSFDTPPQISEIVPNSRASFPLRMAHVDEYVKESVALCGDAAHNTHPLAGQGMNTGIQDAEALTNALSSAIQHGQDPGSIFSLQPYYRSRYFKNHVYLGVADKFHKLYALDNSVVSSVRSLGMSLFDRSSKVKQAILSMVAKGI
ncbi:monooxygenase Coq6 [Schizosaccharomyces cryophilus OY26]|uniref:Ubiquinone biosynthesis monooxygenase COQ6, mitochondrial n=1 Tax=Schizosaccharomyces cryophilus (strain OY26 / ATCC MYA-4695 / CBS 11777 / NBRC 106824 / NRRL Y48691) TaxID=653667 RepID=S9VNB0_SCHCR|nr:monooxygenase Coq6 [Schizosaccharomyces cryophilus OY26]EPY49428.1 monooxygenase Coq6 [Schizosaccharomyces cryophilus OY26]